MTNRPNGIFYVGVTTNLVQRVWQHREGTFKGFTDLYGLKRLVYYEEHADASHAIQREKNIKHWPRAWKARLILEFNVGWVDLYIRCCDRRPVMDALMRRNCVDGRAKPGHDGRMVSAA